MEHSSLKALSERCETLCRELLTAVNQPWALSLLQGDTANAVTALDKALDLTRLSDRLWWIYVQAVHGGVPLAALTSPFEELTGQLPESERLLATVTGVALACRLVERDQRRIALIVLERCFKFANTEFASLIHPVYRGVLQEELSRAEGRKERKSYLEQLEKKIAVANKVALQDPPREQKKQLSMLTEVVEPRQEQAGVNGFESATEVHPRSVRRPWQWTALATIGGGVLVIVLTLQPREIPPEALVSTAVQVEGEQNLVMTLPEIPLAVRRKAAPSPETDVERRLQNLAKRTVGAEPRSAQGNQKELVSLKDGGGGGNKPHGTELQAETPGEPLYYDPKPRAPTLPELDSERLAKNVLESLDTVEQRIQPKLNGEGVQLRGQTLDGSPLQAYEVERFNEPQLFKTIVSTNVLSAPSVLGVAIARLDTNATVQVTSRMGRWLQVRSSGGRTGYISAQDAVEAGKKKWRFGHSG